MNALRRQTCPCGSRLYYTWQYDARLIPLCRTCVKCHDEKMQGYQPEMLAKPKYQEESER